MVSLESIWRLGDLEVWSFIISIAGFALTIALAYSASKNAKSARDAAIQAQTIVRSLDAADQLSNIRQSLELIANRVDEESWNQIAEHCRRIRMKLASLRASRIVSFSEDTDSALQTCQQKVSAIEQQANSSLAGKKNFDPVRLKASVSEQIETISTALQEVREDAEGISNER